MLYHFLYPLAHQFNLNFLNVCRYITFRTFVAFVVACVTAIFFGQIFIKWMASKQFGQVIREDGPKAHLKKAGTPTCGGILILGSVLIGLLFAGNFHSKPFLLTLLTTAAYFFLGLRDDLLKILKKNTAGVSAKGKLFWQFLTAIIVCSLALHWKLIDGAIYLPFIKGPVVDLGLFYVLFGSIVIVGSSNAVNLTDGLDGLAIGPIMTTLFTLAIFAYAGGHFEMSHYLYIPYLEHGGELAIFSAAVVGAGAGFLWYNTYPAQIFMGDVGSLSLGGTIGTMAVLTKNEFLLVIMGGIFVAEALSVILQVGSYKLRKKRIFKMAPIHHHFELLGWPEPKVIVRFWIISLILAIISIATIKTR